VRRSLAMTIGVAQIKVTVGHPGATAAFSDVMSRSRFAG
jgi:hypothetical protein